MNSRLALALIGATSLAVTSVGFAQSSHGTLSTGNLTLLTGPSLLSPPAKISNTPEGIKTSWYRVPSSNAAGMAAPEAVSDAELQEAREQLRAAEERLRKLEAQRATAVAKQNGGPPEANGRMFLRGAQPATPSDPTRFDSTLPAVPTSIFLKPTAPAGWLQFHPAKRD